MIMKTKRFLCAALALGGLCACENLMDELPETLPPAPERESSPDWEETAELLSSLPLGTAQMEEVHHAVSASKGNGFDEEYLLADLFAAPGSGVGDRQLETGGAEGKQLSSAGSNRLGASSCPQRAAIASGHNGPAPVRPFARRKAALPSCGI